MPSRLEFQIAKIDLHNENLKKRINAMIQDSIQRGLVIPKSPITLNPVINENENKEGENKELNDNTKQKLLLNGFFAITPGLTPDNKLKNGGEFNKN